MRRTRRHPGAARPLLLPPASLPGAPFCYRSLNSIPTAPTGYHCLPRRTACTAAPLTLHAHNALHHKRARRLPPALNTRNAGALAQRFLPNFFSPPRHNLILSDVGHKGSRLGGTDAAQPAFLVVPRAALSFNLACLFYPPCLPTHPHTPYIPRVLLSSTSPTRDAPAQHPATRPSPSASSLHRRRA